MSNGVVYFPHRVSPAKNNVYRLEMIETMIAKENRKKNLKDKKYFIALKRKQIEAEIIQTEVLIRRLDEKRNRLVYMLNNYEELSTENW